MSGRRIRILVWASVACCGLALSNLAADEANLVPAAGPSERFYSEAETFLKVVDPMVLGEEGFISRARFLSGGDEPFGLVLSGGSARAFAHIGVLKALEEARISPDYLVADSMGAIVALLYGAGVSPDDIERLFLHFPPATLFEPILPLAGGVLDASRFTALTRALVGDLDLADLPIPVLVLCEDLRSRRQVLLMEGDFATVLQASFSLPAVFEPVPFRDGLLIDGGLTALVPVEAAYRYSERVVVATALYDKTMDFSSAFVVLNRAFDIGKTRRSVEELLVRRPPVIRCDVESLSYMKFSSVREVSARGYASTRAALAEIESLVPGRDLPPALLERRAFYASRISGLIAEAARDRVLPREPDAVVSAELGLVGAAAGDPDFLEGFRYAGPSLRLNLGSLEAGLSVLGGLGGDPARAIALHLGLEAAGGTLGLTGLSGSLEGHAWLLGDSGLGKGMQSAIKDEEGLEGLAEELAGHVTLVTQARAGLVFGGASGPVLRGFAEGGASSALLDPSLDWRFRAGLALASRNDTSDAPRLSGELLGAWLLDASGNSGPEASLRASVPLGGDFFLRFRGRGRAALEGRGWEGSAFPEYRGLAPAPASPLRGDLGLDLVWLARPLEFDVGELLLFQKPEIGVFADLAGAAPLPGDEELLPEAGSIAFAADLGLSLQFGASVMGLSPFEFTAWCGFSPMDGTFSLGLVTGRMTR